MVEENQQELGFQRKFVRLFGWWRSPFVGGKRGKWRARTSGKSPAVLISSRQIAGFSDRLPSF
jgi:hypothetical protein